MGLLSSFARCALLGSMVLGVAVASGCATERDPIDKVQAGSVDKAFFIGAIADPSDDPEFYMRTTVVDVAAGAGSESLFTSSDGMTLVRVRWEITETQLLARLTYEEIENTDHAGRRRTPNGQIVAAYAIQKHFDIRRDYNPQTGEELNIIVENDTDRPWYQRESMRVDWSKNLITDAYTLDTLSQIGIYDGIKFEPVAYWVSDPNSPDAPVFDRDRGYFDVTNKVWASPQLIHDPYWGDIPACQFVGAFPRVSCNPSELTLRQSFLKVVDHDYEALDFDGTRMDMFGFFSSDRYGYDRRYGVIDDKWHRFASRWNIWEKSHAAPAVKCGTAETTPIGFDAHRDVDKNGTEDECEEVGRGSKCDSFRGECTLPLRDRKIKTTAWYVNEGFPEELFAGTAQALGEWNDAIRVAAVAGRLAECRRTKEQGCEADMGWPARWSDDFVPPVGSSSHAEVGNVFVLCHNPVDDTKDDPACGAKGLKPRLGDLRYSFVNLVQSPQVSSPWGISMDAEDPLTGEKIAASVNQWGAVLDRAAATLVDLLDLLNGELDPTKYVTGQNVSEWVKANKLDAVGRDFMSAEELTSRQNAVAPQALAPYSLGSSGKKPVKSPALRRKNRLGALVDAGRMGPGNNVLATRLGALKGSQTEAAMVTPAIAQMVGFNPNAPIEKTAIQRGTPFGRVNPTIRRGNDQAERGARAAHHACRLEAAEPDNLLGMAKVAAKLFPVVDPNDKNAINARRDKVYLWARQQYSNGVFAHEMGHTVGLRHNFAASFDSLNYRPQYWQLRTRNGTATAPCPDGTTDGSLCVGPRWRDPISQDEIDGNIGRFTTTSVMDYPGDQNHDQLLLGKYDRAAMRFGYGDVVDVWAKPDWSVRSSSSDGKRRAYELTAFTTTPGLFGVFDFPPVDPADAYVHIHYSGYQKEFGLISDCQSSTSPDAVLGLKCAEQPLDVVDFRDMSDFAADPALASYSFGVSKHAIDPTGRVRRGYMFSSDEFADTGNVPSFLYDAGADAYEQVRFLESAYENRYILDSFRRNRVEFNSEDVLMRTQAHYLDSIQQISKTFAFGAVLDGDPTAPGVDFMSDGNYGALAMASSVAFDMFARIMTRPEPGTFCDGTSPDCVNVQPAGVDVPLFMADAVPYPSFTYDFKIALGQGRYVHNDFDYSKGYWWSDYQTQVGTYYDKIWATYYLAEAFDSFVSSSKEDFTDGRYKNVSFATVYPDQVRRLFGSVLTGDLATFAPTVTYTANPNVPPTTTPIYPPWHDASGLGARPANAKLVDPNYAFNEQLYAMVWSAIYFPTNWSLSWINDARITALASEQITWPASETYVFVDPKSGTTYRAHGTGTEPIFGVTHQSGVGARMLEWANKLTALAYKSQRDGQNKPLFNPDGTPKLILGGNGKPQLDPDGTAAYNALQKYVSNVDIMRQLTAQYSRPLGDGDLPQQ